MLQNPEFQEQPRPKEKIFDQYGLYVVTDSDAYPLLDKKDPALENTKNVVMVSQPDWETTLYALSNTDFGQTTVLTPELITIAGLPLTDVNDKRPEIEDKIEEVIILSAKKPNVKFLLGTPFFLDGVEKPVNTALVIKSGEILQRSDKKLLAVPELDAFHLDPKIKPEGIDPDRALVVCRDFIGAQKAAMPDLVNNGSENRNNLVSYIYSVTSNRELSESFREAEFIPKNINQLLVNACWGVGFPAGLYENISQSEVDNFYLEAMRLIQRMLFRTNNNLKQIVVCDRVPSAIEGELVSSKPMNAVFFKS
jgi:hypothetical protein